MVFVPALRIDQVNCDSFTWRPAERRAASARSEVSSDLFAKLLLSECLYAGFS